MKPVEIVLTSLSCFNDISIVDSATFSCSYMWMCLPKGKEAINTTTTTHFFTVCVFI